MIDWDRWQEIWLTITRNKIRSIFTAFGIFWGLLMLTVLLGVGNGLENGMISNIKGFATNSCFFYAERTSEPYKGFKKNREWYMHNSDMYVILMSIPEIKYLSPMLFGSSSDKNIVRGLSAGTFGVRGCYPDYSRVEEQRIQYGRYINDVDIREKRKVCYIGKNVYEALFKPGENPLGQPIRCNGMYYTVIGVGSGVSDVQIGGRSEALVVLPFTTMQSVSNLGDRIHFMAVVARDDVDASCVEAKVKAVLKERNNIAPNDGRAVGSFNIDDQFTIFKNLFIGIHLLIWLVGIGTLLAGAVGVSNIMLVSVRERTKEIGIRRAIGAKPGNIVLQILDESLVLTAIAGFIGLSFGVGILAFFDNIINNMPSESGVFIKNVVIRFDVAVLASFILIVVGLLSGMLPAWRALKIKPIEALNEE